MNLGQLFSSLTVEDLHQRWSSGRFYVEHGEPSRIDGVAELPHNLEAFLPSAAYYGTLSAFRADENGELAPLHGISAEHARQLYARGHSIQCAGAHHCPELSGLAGQLAQQLGMPQEAATARYIFSPPGAPQAYGWHFDTANVIAVQLGGSKVWQLAANDAVRFPHRAGHPSQPARGPLNGLPGLSPLNGYAPRYFDPSILNRSTRVELQPGSVLFNPGGHWHRTSEVGAQGSCSVSFLFEPDSWLKVLVRGLVATLVADERWRAPALMLSAPGRARQKAQRSFAERVDALKRMFQEVDPAVLLERAQQSRVASLPTETTTFLLDPNVSATVERLADGRWQLVVTEDDGATDVEIDQSLVALCRWVLATEGITFSVTTALVATSADAAVLSPSQVDCAVTMLSVLETLGVIERTA